MSLTTVYILLAIIGYVSYKKIQLEIDFSEFKSIHNRLLRQKQTEIQLLKVELQIERLGSKQKPAPKLIDPNSKAINLIKLAVNESASLEESRTAAIAACRILAKKIK